MLPTTFAASLALAISAPAFAQASAAIASGKAQPSPLSPGEIVTAAPAKDWTAIAPSDLLVMTIAPDRDGNPRQVVIQLMPAPFSQGWIGNILKLAAAHWWDGTSINRVQDNYVVQWGDADAEDKAKAKRLPNGLVTPLQTEYVTSEQDPAAPTAPTLEVPARDAAKTVARIEQSKTLDILAVPVFFGDPYARVTTFIAGWPVGLTRLDGTTSSWPVHCYGMVGVGRDLPPNTGTGAELYTVIGHAPRHLDRNIALVGRVIEGIEHLSSLPRGHGALGFYDLDKGDKRVPIVSIRLATELPAAEQPRFEYLSTESDSFAKYADSRANRRDGFFIAPAGGADVCNIPVPVRRVAAP